MSSGLLGIARSALLTHQTALQTISHNIANAETPGYSRQEAMLQANSPVSLSYGNVGTGVSVLTIARKRDVLLDDNYRSASGSAGQSSMRSDLLTRLESMFGEPTDAGMSAAVDRFFDAWSDLAASPSSGAAKAVVQQRGQQLAQLFNQYDTQLTQQRSTSVDRITNSVAEINAIATQVADINNRIVTSEAGGDTAGDLRDQRDLMLDRLSTLAGTRVIPQADGSVSVIIGNSTLVDSTTARLLNVNLIVPNPPPAVTSPDLMVRISLGNSPDQLQPLGGELKALTQFVNSDVPNMRGRLDAMASAIAITVNAEHVQNFVFTGSTIPGVAAGNFFDPGSVGNPVRASTFRLTAAIAGDSSGISVSRDASAPMDNSGGRALSALRDAIDSVTFTDSAGVTESGTFAGFYRGVLARLGIDVKTAEDDSQVQQTLVEQADRRRESVSGVNTDEELVQLLRVQQAYTAATKLVKAADEMLQTLLSLV